MRQFQFFAFLVDLIDSFAQRTFLIAGIIERTVCFIITQKIFHFIFAVGHFLDEVATHAVPVQMTETVTLTKQTESFGIELDIVEDILLNIIR